MFRPSPLRLSVLQSLLIALVFAALTLLIHAHWIRQDYGIPLGDEPGHLTNVIRYRQWFMGMLAPAEPHPPAMYVASALSSLWLEGDRLQVLRFGPAFYGALLVGGMSWLGARSFGLGGAFYMGCLALAAPQLLSFSRMFLLDLPMTALVVLIWIAVLESRHLSRTLPTLLLGAFLAWGMLAKYTIVLWLLPLLLWAGVAMVLRYPIALLPLLIPVLPLYHVAEVVVRRADVAGIPGPVRPAAEPLLWELGAAALLLGGIAVAAAIKRRSGLKQGAVLGLAMLLCVALVLPWALLSANAVYAKVLREAIDEVRTSAPVTVQTQTWLFLRSSWPSTWYLLWLGLIVEVVGGLLWLAGRKWAWLRDQVEGSWPSLPIWGLVLGWTGYTLTFRSLPFDTRYVIPLVPCAIFALSGVLRLRWTRRVVAPVICLICVLQVVAGLGWLGEDMVVRQRPFAEVGPGKVGPATLVAPPAPHSASPFPEIHTLFRTLAPMVPPLNPPDGCQTVALQTLDVEEGRSRAIDGQGIMFLLMLEGLDECVWQRPAVNPKLVVVVDKDAGSGEVVVEEKVKGLILGIYRQAP